MDERLNNLVTAIRDSSLAEALYAHGATPDEVKDALVEVFEPFTDNLSYVKRNAANCLVADAVTLLQVREDPWARRLLEELLRIHRAALVAREEESCQALVGHLPFVMQGLSRYWSQFNLQIDKSDLALEEFVHESLREIGVLIEGVAKDYLFEAAHQERILAGHPTTVEEVRQRDLGGALDLLARAAPQREVYEISGIRLNQWRNIAQHFSARVEGIEIVVSHHAIETRLSRNELGRVVSSVAQATRAFKMAYTIVFHDNADDMRARNLMPVINGMRMEASLTMLLSGIASQGFSVLDASVGPPQSLLVVQDTTTLEPHSRAIHASQFVLPLFQHAPTQRVIVEYRTAEGTPTLRAVASRELLERVLAEDRPDFGLLAREVTFERLPGWTP